MNNKKNRRELHVELTNRCNLTCKMCFRHTITRKIGDMEFANYTKLLEKSKHLDFNKVNLHLHGEPLLYGRLTEAIDEAKKYFGEAEIYTNGLALTEELSQSILKSRLDRISFSVTGLTNQTYHQFQGYRTKVDVQKIYSNILKFLECKSRSKANIKVIMHYILTEDSMAELDEYIAFWEDKVDDIEINFINSWLDHLSSGNQKFVNYKKCKVIENQVAVLVDGSVTTCCQDFVGANVFGNINETALEDILASGKYRKWLDANNKLQLEDLPPICRKCDQVTGKHIRGMRAGQYKLYQKIVADIFSKHKADDLIFYGVNDVLHHVYWTLQLLGDKTANICFIDNHKEGTCYGQPIMRPMPDNLIDKKVFVFEQDAAEQQVICEMLDKYQCQYECIPDLVKINPGI